jgi:hypothetical protein
MNPKKGFHHTKCPNCGKKVVGGGEVEKKETESTEPEQPEETIFTASQSSCTPLERAADGLPTEVTVKTMGGESIPVSLPVNRQQTLGIGGWDYPTVQTLLDHVDVRSAVEISAGGVLVGDVFSGISDDESTETSGDPLPLATKLEHAATYFLLPREETLCLLELEALLPRATWLEARGRLKNRYAHL